ncbi:hypothetical protein OB955_11805 [Halobacteria archaeon AArc-m2/3/4]|uniref:DUF624 domain-containing protein n=1 Tax=Natronoglomus mannanivorans TaxID=2979990 RepID=A0AAP3E2D0_9EURY|nr:hypothetical protein [Halobacteria archaeon AArc-xg1-1]MCU4973425.1 hypothetical protein [Halobacteria archaeon AArc-m2/3/4]
MSISSKSDVDRLGASITTTKHSVYDHSSTLVLISVCWFVASLPLITIGPATVGAYAGITSVLEDQRLDRRHALRTARKQFVPSLVCSVFPTMFAIGTLAFTLEFLTTESALAAVLAIGSLYAAAFSVLVLIPTFVWLSRGVWAGTAIKRGYLWVVSHPTLALTTGIVTLLVFVVTAALTIGFVLLFAAIAFTFHLLVIPDRD